MQDVVVTGIGPIVPNCDNRRTLWSQLRDGQSQLTLEPDPARPELLSPMGRIHGFDARKYLHAIPERYYSRCSRSQLLYFASLTTAIDDAGLQLSDMKSDRVGLFDGTSRDNFDFWHARMDGTTDQVNKKDLPIAMPGMAVGLASAMLGVRGPTYTFAGTCTSGVISIGHALRELQLGEIDVALASGHDAALLGRFYDIYRDAQLLSEEHEDARRAVRPYIEHSKNVFGEGSITLVLETREHAEARGATIMAELSGYKFGNTGAHPTHIDATGERPAALISSLLERRRVMLEDVGFVVGHGNGVDMSDRSEIKYMRQIFGERAGAVPLLSTKPNYGHMLGASGALSVGAAALMLHHEFIIPTINVNPERERESGMNHQAGRGKAQSSKAALVMAYGMGGNNAALLLKRAGNAAKR